MTPILIDNVGILSCGSPGTSSFFLITKWREAQVKNTLPPEAQEVAKCLLTGESATESPVYLCHVFHECYWSNHPMLSCLEWAWGMKYDTIQMDVDTNMISRAYFLWDRWDRFPLHEGNVPSIEGMYDGADIFEYRLVPLLSDLPPVSRCNKAEHVSEGKRDDTAGASVFSYPFDTLPPIFSRAKPHFVVCDAGRKLDVVSYKCCTTTSAMARIYGVPQKTANLAKLVVLQTFRIWNDHVHPATFVTSPRTNDSRSRSGLIRPGQPNPASQRVSRPKKRTRTTGEVMDAVCPQSNVVRYVTCLSHVSPCGSDALIVGDSGWDTEDTEVYAEFERKQVRRAIKASKRWVRDCEREAQSSGGWISCVTDDEQVKSYRQEPARRMISTM
ncbi:hypothetical protein HETIRDRAFT_321429 [Heterobasidion irregulare TC 32-1]|uniref:HNH nuclease domain-containing protein n=1 Tax=Heterobasidion irregulare (strain TC 32-1) TaxID=747525 RepID=W4K261_HETIT|nr:uncharacterized protein HETIRDRAFT_321429 [Heterobasidion irregulare TC 32-1]ETW79435.1 hypothetical protein HETIRDRAFT_321429 [Heterobasidion irregulare TC 32-1]